MHPGVNKWLESYLELGSGASVCLVLKGNLLTPTCSRTGLVAQSVEHRKI